MFDINIFQNYATQNKFCNSYKHVFIFFYKYIIFEKNETNIRLEYPIIYSQRLGSMVDMLSGLEVAVWAQRAWPPKRDLNNLKFDNYCL